VIEYLAKKRVITLVGYLKSTCQRTLYIFIFKNMKYLAPYPYPGKFLKFLNTYSQAVL
jgi:hypothetical protein